MHVNHLFCFAGPAEVFCLMWCVYAVTTEQMLEIQGPTGLNIGFHILCLSSHFLYNQLNVKLRCPEDIETRPSPFLFVFTS